MSRDASSTAINESYENIRHRQETPPDLSGPEELLLPPEDLRILDAIQRRVLWLCTFMIHHANHVRPNTEDLKVAGHQASSASMVSILTALYFRYLQAGDRVSIKPHASPAYHAIQYLLGNLDQQYLPTLRAFNGLQAYPSRTKDPDPVDFSTGSVGLGAVAPAFAAVVHRYAHNHFGQVTSHRFVAVIGDAELGEGSVWEAAFDEALQGLGNMLLIVDLNRQSLDRVVPGIRATQLKRLFQAANWQVVEAKYGQQLQHVFARPGGMALRRRLDEISNEEYRSLLRRSGSEIRTRLLHAHGTEHAEDQDIALALNETPDEQLSTLLSNLGGHDLNSLLHAFSRADRQQEVPTVVFAYTIKGWGLPFAGEALNHSMLLSTEQMARLQQELGIPGGREWDRFPSDSPEGRWCQKAAGRLQRENEQRHPLLEPEVIPARIDLSYPSKLSTQEAFGRVLPKLADLPHLGERIVTAVPDVAVSTKKIDQQLLEPAVQRLSTEGIAAHVLHITSPQKLFALFTEECHRRLDNPRMTGLSGHLQTLFSPKDRFVPIVTVQDASAHSLAFLGGLSGVPAIPLGVDRFGQSGTQIDLYRYVGISVDDIVSAGYVAWESGEDARSL
jgi:pyruvate dehydrogenase E1 component